MADKRRIDLKSAVECAYKLGVMDGRKDAEREYSREYECMRIANKNLMKVLLEEHESTCVQISLKTAGALLSRITDVRGNDGAVQNLREAYDLVIESTGRKREQVSRES